ncbi:MAG: ABC transporter substrate-binding protein [Candidatus Dependentiae bacterium]|nr:ABC transporter substrate-binding protein [Candidatus Dependentiae bacterium]
MSKMAWTVVLIIFVAVVALLLRREYGRRLPEMPEPIIVGTTADFPPFSFKQAGDFAGFDIDLIREVAHRLNRRMVIENVPFELLVPQLQHGDLHVVAAGITPTPARSRLVLFSHSYLTNDPLLVLTSAEQRRPTDFADLVGKKILVNAGYNADAYLSKMSNITLIRVPNIVDAVAALMQGKGDAFVTSLNTIRPILDQYGKEKFKLLMMRDVDEELAFGVCPLYPPLRDAINRALQDLEKEGFIEQLKAKWQVQ